MRRAKGRDVVEGRRVGGGGEEAGRRAARGRRAKVRRPKPEGRRKAEIRNPKAGACSGCRSAGLPAAVATACTRRRAGTSDFGLRHFGLPSAFGLRISGFHPLSPSAPGLEEGLERLREGLGGAEAQGIHARRGAKRGPVRRGARRWCAANFSRTAARLESTSSNSPVSASSIVSKPGGGQRALARVMQVHADQVVARVGEADFLRRYRGRRRVGRRRGRSCAGNR